MQTEHAPVTGANDDFLSVGAAAKLLKVHPDTLKRWQRAGHISGERTPTGHRRFRRSDVDALVERMASGAES